MIKIICVNYNTIFDNIDELNKILDIKTKKKIEKKETIHTMEHYDALYEIYKPLIDIMNKNSHFGKIILFTDAFINKDNIVN